MGRLSGRAIVACALLVLLCAPAPSEAVRAFRGSPSSRLRTASERFLERMRVGQQGQQKQQQQQQEQQHQRVEVSEPGKTKTGKASAGSKTGGDDSSGGGSLIGRVFGSVWSALTGFVSRCKDEGLINCMFKSAPEEEVSHLESDHQHDLESDSETFLHETHFVSSCTGLEVEGVCIEQEDEDVVHYRPRDVQPQQNAHFKKQDKIAIVGAGPGGLYMYYTLKKRGFNDVTILERTGRVGGKSYSLWREEQDGAGQAHATPHEMGTCYLSQAYGIIRELAQELGCQDAFEPPQRRSMFHKSFYDNEDIWGAEIAANARRGAHHRDLPHYGKDNVFAQCIEGGGSRIWCKVKVSFMLVRAIWIYNRAHRRAFGAVGPDSFPINELSPEQMQMIDMPYIDFLRAAGADGLIGILQFAYPSQGYGPIERIPAFYGLLWITPQLMNAYIRSALPFGKKNVLMFKEGWSCLWQKIKLDHQPNIKFNVDIQSIARSPADVTIKYTERDGGQSHEDKFDFLVLGSNLKSALTFIDATDDEREIFSTLRGYTLTTTLYTAAPMRHYTDQENNNAFLTDVDNLMTGGVYADRHSARAVHEGFENFERQTRVSYQFFEEMQTPDFNWFPPDEVAQDHVGLTEAQKGTPIYRRLCESMAEKGLECDDMQMRAHFTWPYFPHYEREQIQAKYPWRVIQMQGMNRTWYVGASTVFESVLDIVKYINMLWREMMPEFQPE